jgi:predicted 3-demethylubiquinone-9 3-methyltransferase (glyoxalase superfamily)
MKDRYGLSSQIIPTALEELLSDPDPGRSLWAMAAMLSMHQLDIAPLQRAADSG